MVGKHFENGCSHQKKPQSCFKCITSERKARLLSRKSSTGEPRSQKIPANLWIFVSPYSLRTRRQIAKRKRPTMNVSKEYFVMIMSYVTRRTSPTLIYLQLLLFPSTSVTCFWSICLHLQHDCYSQIVIFQAISVTIPGFH